MTLSEEVKDVIAQLARLLDDPVLEPNPDRSDWASARAALDHVQTVVETQLLARLAAGAAPLAAGADVQRAAADVTALIAATLQASGRSPAARGLFERALGLATSMQQKAGFAAAVREPSTFVLLAHAHWLEARGKLGPAAARREQVRQVTSEPALRTAAEDALGKAPPPRASGDPVRSAPVLFRLNGCGLGIYGNRDRRSDGTSIATYCLSLFWIPVLPLRAYRVVRDGDRVGFISHEPLSQLTRIVRTTLLAGVVLLIVAGGISKWQGSPERKARKAIAAAEQVEKKGPPDAAVAAWEHVLEDWDGKVDSATLAPAANALVRIAIAGVHQPFQPADLDAERRVVARYEQLPEPQRDATRKRLTAALLAWADQLGAADGGHARAGLRLLDELARIDPDTDLGARRVTLRRGLAAALASDEPIGALRLLLQNGGDQESLTTARTLLAPVVHSPSLILDLDDLLDSWLGYAERFEGTAELAKQVRAAVAEARQRKQDSARQALLDEPDEAKLRAALASAPSDQELTVALAQLLAARGDLAGAAGLLEAFGKPGTLVGGARVMLASLRRETGDLVGAEAVLSGWLDWRLAPFQEAAQRYVSAERNLREKLVADLKAGRYDGELAPKVEGMSEADRNHFLGQWFEDRLGSDANLATLRQGWQRHIDVVAASLLLGQVKLERARAASGSERDALLAGAEQAYLGVQSVAAGAPSYHLGLGQVYYRLGRPADGEKQFDEARTIGAPETLMELADKYRDLGIYDRARVEAEKVADNESAGEPLRNSAAVLRSMLADNEEDEEKWLRRSQNEQAKLGLLQLEAGRLLRDGKPAEADAKYAEVARAYGKNAAVDSASANNAAIALLQRFVCTGDLGHIDQAIKLHETSVRLRPDDSIGIVNLANALLYRARLRVLDRWVQVRVLRPAAGEVETALGALESGPLGEQVRAALRLEPAFRRALDLVRRRETLSPQETGGYLKEFEMLAEIRDDAGLRALIARVTPLSGFHTADHNDQQRRWLAGETDAQYARSLHGQLARLQRVADLPDDKASARTRAAAWVLISGSDAQLATIEHEPAIFDHAESAARKALALAPDVGSKNLLGWTLLGRAFEQAGAGDDDLTRTWKTAQRRYPTWLAAWTLATSEHGSAYLAALRAQPGARESASLVDVSDPGPGDWALFWLLGDEARQRALLPGFDRERSRLSYELRTHLFADDEDEQLEARFFAGRGQVASAAKAAPAGK